MKNPRASTLREVTALKVSQWLDEWNRVQFREDAHRRKPDAHFYVFTLGASDLKALSGIYRRTTRGGHPRTEDLGIQRRHDETRSNNIRQFIQYGYPWSDLTQAKRESGEFDDLRKPGWLPTAIVVNILKKGDERQGQQVASADLMTVIDTENRSATIKLPHNFSGADWRPTKLHPMEVIDGQHRLWAFESEQIGNEYELPVVAFHGLDISWQAYLFWTINIKPKRINASLAFDLYPLLRTEDWLERFEGHSIYRETRAQEIVEALWVHAESPWYQWINMLGESGLKKSMVTQAAWVRALMTTYVKAWEGRGVQIGGLFGAPVGTHRTVLPWSRAQQAAFLISFGKGLRDSVKNSSAKWAKQLRAAKDEQQDEARGDPAFYGPHTLLNTDQGIRGFLHVSNDLCYVKAEELELLRWQTSEDAGAVDEAAVSDALRSFRRQSASRFVNDIAEGLADYDWRTSSAPDLTEEEQTLKASFRGSGGYKQLRRELLRHLANKRNLVGKTAKEVYSKLGYE